MKLVDLCAGSGAVSLRYLGGPRARPLTGWRGGKRRYATAILEALGLVPGDGTEALLVDAGPYGEAWTTLLPRREAVVDILRGIETDTDTLGVWRDLAEGPVPVDPAERVATWLVLQAGAALGKEVRAEGGAWRTPGPGRSSREAIERYGPCYSVRRIREALEEVPDGLRALHGRAEALEVPTDASGVVVYVDPPYVGTCGYSEDLARDAVLEVALRWAEAGALVAVSEGEPVEGLLRRGWTALEVATVGRGVVRRGRREVLTTSRGAPRQGEQLALFHAI